MQTNGGKLNRREFAAAGTALATASLLGVAASPGGEVSTRPTLSAGAAEVVVTPAAEGTFLVGPMKDSTIAIVMKRMARTVVARDRNEAAPRPPNTAPETPPPPNAPASPSPFADWRSTVMISAMQMTTYSNINRVYIKPPLR